MRGQDVELLFVNCCKVSDQTLEHCFEGGVDELGGFFWFFFGFFLARNVFRAGNSSSSPKRRQTRKLHADRRGNCCEITDSLNTNGKARMDCRHQGIKCKTS